MIRLNKSFAKILLGALAGLAFATTSARSGEIDSFDVRMQPILVNYLRIQSALANDSLDGVEEAATSIAHDASRIDVTHATGEHTEHYRHLSTDLQTSAHALSKAPDLRAARHAFKQLSKPMAMWGTMSKPAGIDVMYCSMAKASWLQKHGDVRNPYYGKSMLTCGQVVGGAGYSEQPTEEHNQKPSATHSAHGGCNH